jgi:uncharacterized Zn finger protein
VSSRRTAVNTRSYQRQAERLFDAINYMRSGMEIYSYTGTAASEMEDLIEQAASFTRNGDGENALPILDAITEPCVRHWFDLDDSDGYAEGVFEDLGMAWAEALLTADLSPDEYEYWQSKLEEWQAEISQYGIDACFEAAIAITRGDRDADLDVADESNQMIVEARLNVMEQQGRTDEFLSLARASGHMMRYARMLVQTGRIAEAVQTGLHEFATAAEAHTLVTTLHEHGQIDAALRVAEHHLPRSNSSDRLAEWLRDVAQQQGRRDLALRAAEVAFRSAPTLQSYHAVQDLAGEQWAQIRPPLLDYLRNKPSGLSTQYAEIFLHENLIDDAIAVVERGYSYSLLDRVLAAAVEQRPDWVIAMGTKQAEDIIDRGKAQHYYTAVQRLALVRRAYEQTGRSDDWQSYIKHLRETHGRKHKLMDLLRRM